MKNTIHLLSILLLIMLINSCSERRSEEAKGTEVELAGDEPDETSSSNEQILIEYNPADTIVNLSGEEFPSELQDFSQVLVNTYLDMEEALLLDNSEEVKEKATQLISMLQRHEQENMDLSPQVKDLFTNSTYILRQSAQNMLNTNDFLETRAAFSAMGPAAYKLAKVSSPAGTKLYYQFCSESFGNRGAYWLSRSKEINNPYAEQNQQRCGKTIAVL